MREFLDISQLFAKAIEKAYRDGEDDYNMRPIVLKKSENEPIGTINSGDSVVFAAREESGKFNLQIALLHLIFHILRGKIFQTCILHCLLCTMQNILL